MRVIFAGGGTGGHLYPGLAIARALKQADPRVEPFFIGARRGIERDVLPQVGFAFELLDLHPLYRSRPWENWRTLRGAMTAWRMIAAEVRSEPPACVVGTGGYASGLALGYATAHHIPFVLQEQNTQPGITARFFSRYAAQVHLGFPEARRHLSPGKSTEIFDSGNPIEPPPRDAFDKAPARAKWGFPSSGGRVLLVYGGSQGSAAMNGVVADWIERGLPSDLFVIWATGKANYEKLARYESDRVKVRAYIAPIAEAYRAADFALSRAGAMATAELCAWGIPAIVVPLPTAAADHQTANARALAAAGAAEMIRQSELDVERLSQTVQGLLSNPGKLSEMRTKSLARARPTAAADIAAHILALVGREQSRR
jgi:UDP-N-acetylglucosamine--N-acetylmuramyl-(pentapeptide) pyrophosphoryl-undecaprenol N-acetylglucosamine transferase